MRFVLVLLPLAALLGCGGEPSYPVSGKITLDDQPLAGALVSFVSQGKPLINSVSLTDEQGRYELQQTQALKGIPAGAYRVHVSTYRDSDDPGTATTPERVPACYNFNSTLQATVAAGENEIDFDLTSDGRIPTTSAAGR